MVSKRAWAAYPPHYRAKEKKIMAAWIQSGESGAIVGLAGAGKSNLLGYLTHQPHAIRQYLPDHSAPLALVQVDLNNLPDPGLSTLYRVILRSLYEATAQLNAVEKTLPPAIEKLYRKTEDKADPFLSQSALREALFLFQQEGARLVLVLDPFDQFCRTAATPLLDTLRGLRDGFKATLSYIVGLRSELAYLRDPAELGELYELLDTYHYWLGPMEKNDACWVMEQVERAAGCAFDQAQRQRLFALTGGYPALLKAASLWLVKVHAVPPPQAEWPAELLAEPALQNRLQELWSGLTREEQAALVILQKTLQLKPAPNRQKNLQQVAEKYRQPLNHLQTKHLCQPTAEIGWQIFSPLLSRFIDTLAGLSAGKIWRDADSNRFFQGETELTNLSEKDRRLLRHFLDQPRGAIHTLDDMIEAAWPEDESSGVTNQAVQQAIRHLRKQIEPNPAKPTYLITEHKSGYRFFPEGSPGG